MSDRRGGTGMDMVQNCRNRTCGRARSPPTRSAAPCGTAFQRRTKGNKKGWLASQPAFFYMAEREGFEPSVEYNPHTRLAGEHHRPTRSSLLSRHSRVSGGGSRIRTHGTFAQRFSRPPPSTARPFLQPLAALDIPCSMILVNNLCL